MEPNLVHEAIPTFAGIPQTCYVAAPHSLQPSQTAICVSDVKHLLGHASTADCIYNKPRTKLMFVGCGGEKADEADSRVTSCAPEVALGNSLCWRFALGGASV